MHRPIPLSLYLPGKQPHYGGVRSYAVLQLHGLGPFTINLVTPPEAGNR